MRARTRRIGVVAAVVAAFLLGGATYGVVQMAGASGTNPTYYACLHSGVLTQVGKTSPTCTIVGARVISWNSVGPQGVQGVPGIQGPAGPQGPQGPGAISTSGDFAYGNDGAFVNLTLTLPSGTYSVSWDVFNGTGGCGYSSGTNVTTVGPFGQRFGLVTVGDGGGTVTLGCTGNGTPGMVAGAFITAVPTVMR